MLLRALSTLRTAMDVLEVKQDVKTLTESVRAAKHRADHVLEVYRTVRDVVKKSNKEENT